MSTTKYVIVYNAGTGPYETDPEEGSQILPGHFAVATRANVKQHIDDNQLVIVNPDDITNQSQPTAVTAKAEWTRLTEPKPEDASDQTAADDYDTSSSTTKGGSSKSSSRTTGKN